MPQIPYLASSIQGGGTLGGEEEGGAVTFYQGVLFSTSRELWFGQQLCLGARLQLGGLGGDEMKESESFIMIIVCLVGSFIVSACSKQKPLNVIETWS